MKDSGSNLLFFTTHFFLINALFFIIREFDLWHILNVSTMKPEYADLRAYTAQVSCIKEGIDYRVENCDSYGRKIGLLQVWVPLFEFLNFDEPKTALIGNSLQIVFFMAIYFLAFKLKIEISKARNYVPFTLILVSPPLALLIERGQTEMFLFVSITLCVFLVRRRNITIAFLILALLSILKLYPFVVILFVLLSSQVRRNKRDLIVGVGIVISVLQMLFIFRHALFEVTDLTASQGFIRNFGITNVAYIIETILNRNEVTEIPVSFENFEPRIIGYSIFFLCTILVIVFYSWRKAQPFTHQASNELIQIVNLVFMAMVFISYFLVSSADYRMLYLIPVFLCYLKMAETNVLKTNSYRLAIFLLTLMWAQYQSFASAIFQPFLLLFISTVAVKPYFALNIRNKKASPSLR
jgi:hypothetical protein